MFRIAICDDESYFRKSLEGYISNYMSSKGIVFQIDTYNSGEALLSLGIEMMQYKIIFLDINMNKVDGIMVAKKIRQISKEVFIVFVTAYIDYTLEGYKVDAIRYLLKENINFQDTINECIDAIIEKANYSVVKKEFRFNEGVKKISLERVFYIESKLHKLEFHIMSNVMKTYTMYDTLNTLERELEGNNFVRIHQSYLVNLKYIQTISRYKAVLTNGEELVIPKARYIFVRDKYIEYQGEV